MIFLNIIDQFTYHMVDMNRHFRYFLRLMKKKCKIVFMLNFLSIIKKNEQKKKFKVMTHFTNNQTNLIYESVCPDCVESR